MFGTFRLMLALMVVYSHFAGGGLGGPVAVFGFFCLSGYLMTKIVNESYSDGVIGFFRYLSNRALRIYPAYYAAIVFAAAVLLLWPMEARTAAGWYRFPQVAANPQHHRAAAALTHPACARMVPSRRDCPFHPDRRHSRQI